MTAGAWPSGPDEGDRRHSICRRWAGEDPEPFRDLTGTSEWHATLWYTPTDRNRVPGNTLVLEIEVVLARRGWTDRLRESVQLVSGLELGNSIITLRNYVKVHLAADPLPRFNRRWLYGDFHYHAQGTDNEGEAAYNYRGVIRSDGRDGAGFSVRHRTCLGFRPGD